MNAAYKPCGFSSIIGPKSRAGLAACVFALTLTNTAVAQSSDTDDDIAALREQLEALQALVAEQAEKIEALEQSQADSAAPEIVRLTPIDDEADDGERVFAVSRQPLGRFPDDAIVTADDFDGALIIPGTDASVRIGGFVRAEGNYDFDSLGFQDTVSPRRIPLDGSTEDGDEQVRFHVRNTRLNFDYRRPTDYGDFRTFVEFDLFGGGNELISNYEVRLRHAAAQLGNLYVGQWWSYFVDIAATPEGADYGGPMGAPVARNPGVRWAQDVGDSWRWGVGLENPAGDLSGPDTLLASDSVPNFTGFIQLTRPWGRVRVAGLGLQLESTTDSVFTGGVNISGRLNTTFLGENNNLAFAVQAGEGFMHYYSAYSGVGLEGVVDELGNVEATGVLGGYVAYQHWWTQTLRSTFQASAFSLDSPDGSDPLAFDSGERYGANLFWTPLDGATFGVETIHATRDTFSAGSGDGTRLHVSARFDF